MPRILILAYGNPLRCDDGLAWHVAEKLLHLNLPRDVEIITRHQLTPEVAFSLSLASTVLFIDAAHGGVPGELACVPLKPQLQASVFTHEFSPAAILSVAQELYGASPTAFTISVCGECFDHGETLSPKVLEALPRVITRISELTGEV
jgi:hydrogenase maturation protease